MLDRFLRLITSVDSGPYTKEERFATWFFLFLSITVCAGCGCLLFLVFALYGFHSDVDVSVIHSNLSTAATLGLVSAAFGYIASRWFREDFNSDD